MVSREDIKIAEYNYNLPQERIAKFPLEKRDESKILIFREGSIEESKFKNLSSLIPSEALMIFNTSKVIPARLLFQKESGAIIEIFCLEPVEPPQYERALNSVDSCSWNVVIGNKKRWKKGALSLLSNGDREINSASFKAHLVSNNQNREIVRFEWSTPHTFSELLNSYGNVPIPPYLKREMVEEDRVRYQTVYAKMEGSVAAPTAGLHFSKEVIESLKSRKIAMGELLLHVGAGTFVPVKSEKIVSHKMHSELFTVSIELLKRILKQIEEKRAIISVGTTSARTLESLYWFGAALERGEMIEELLQWTPYIEESTISSSKAFKNLISWMEERGVEEISKRTEIIILPGYKFRVVDLLITNFHQPQSTLLLLIAAFIGEDWKRVYSYALESDFRFLSYGDSSLLYRATTSL